MAAPVQPLQPLRLPKGPSPTTPEQRYWRTFKSPKLLPSPQNAPITHISHPYGLSSSQLPSSFTTDNPSTDLFAVTSGTRIQLLSTRTLKPLKTISRFSPNDIARSGHIRRDTRVLSAGSDSGVVQVFDAASRAILRTFAEHKQPVWAVRWHPRELTTLLTASDDRTLRLWDLTESASVVTLTGHADYVRAAGFLGEAGGAVVSGSYDGSVRVWDPRVGGSSTSSSGRTGEVMCFKHAAPVESILPLPSGTALVSAAGSQLHVLDLVAARPLANLRCHQKTVTSLALASGGSRVVSGALDGHVKVYDTASWTVAAGSKYPSPVLSLGVIPASATERGEDRHLAVGLQSGVLSVKTRLAGAQKTAQKQRDREMAAMVAGTLEQHDARESLKKRKNQTQRRRAALRGTEYDGKGADIVIAPDEKNDRRKKGRKGRLAPWDQALRKLEYGKALDLALEARPRNPPGVLAVLTALYERSALGAALAHRDEGAVAPLLRFLERAVADSRVVMLATRVALAVLEEYGGELGESQVLEEGVGRLHRSVRRNVEAGQVAQGTVGMVEMLMGGGARVK